MAAAALSSSSSSLQRCSLASRATAPRRAAPARAPLAVRANAAIKPPQGVTLPPVQPSVPPSKFGFVENAERLNSRAAMIGFVALLLVELVAGKGILNLLGVTVGQGLGFEF